MDTRNKIVPPGVIPQGDGRARTLVIGYFDAVYAHHARRLRSVGEHLIVAIDDPADALLPWRARAELVAGISCVDHVIPLETVSLLHGLSVIDQRADDRIARQQLMEHVLARHDA